MIRKLAPGLALAAAAVVLAVVPAPSHADQLPPVGAKLAPHSVPPCEFEDGSGQALCIWDGQHMGNGIGRSVIIRNGGTERGTIRFISHRNAHRLMTSPMVGA